MACRKDVHCSQCGKPISRVTWNYAKCRPIEDFFCDTSCKGLWQIAKRESLGFNKEWLVDQYHTQGKSANQIAREVGRDPKRVWEWIKDYGLETRPRGHNYEQLPDDDGRLTSHRFKKGERSAFKGKIHSQKTKDKIRADRMADGHVPYLKDGIHWLKHDGAISPAWKGGITPERQAFYASPEWAEAVKSVWARDNAFCQNCGNHHNQCETRGTFHIHHIVSFRVAHMRAEPSNLVLLCRPCHLWVHSKLNIDKKFIEEYSDDMHSTNH